MPRQRKNIYKRKDGRWEGRYAKNTETGKTQYGYVYGKTYNETAEKLSLVTTSADSENPYENIAFSSIADEWIKLQAAQLKESSVAKYRNILSIYLLPKFGNCAAHTIRRSEIIAYTQRLNGSLHITGFIIRMHTGSNNLLLRETNMTIDKLNKAITFAAEKHSAKTRKGTSIPYIVHPMEAAAIAAYLTDDLEIIAAAVLHDVVEDSDATKEDVERLFGSRVAELVASDSEDKMEHIPASASWRMRKQATIDQLESTDRDEQIIVLADKLSNMRTLYKDYCEIGDEVWLRFNQKDKSEHAWYYRSIGEKLDKLKDTVPHHEYMDLVDRVFGK